VRIPTQKLLETKARSLNEPIRPLAMPEVSLLLQQEYGPAGRPTVQVGQRVRVGELVALSAAEGRQQLRTHASIAGVVGAICPRPAPNGRWVDAVVIEGDGSEGESLNPPLEEESPETIRAAVTAAGIVGLGGAGFPVHAKWSVASDGVDSVIVNACESEPYLTCDYRVLIEQAEDVVDGLHLARQAVGAGHGYIAMGDERRDATRNLDALLDAEGGNRVVHFEYAGALGYEKTLIRTILGRQVRFGELPPDVGVIVHNVQTAVAISRAARRGEALTSRVVTVSGGGIARPGNYRLPIGATVQAILDACGWQPERTAAVVLGGPMMGVAVDDLQTPILKGTCGVLALTPEEVASRKAAPCIQIGCCANACPLGLVPAAITRQIGASPAELAALWPDYCVECGECESACPSGRPLLAQMKQAKAILAEWRETER
jgi:electron transport complex protein RnfC